GAGGPLPERQRTGRRTGRLRLGLRVGPGPVRRVVGFQGPAPGRRAGEGPSRMTDAWRAKEKRIHPDPTSRRTRSSALPAARALVATFIALSPGAAGVSRAQPAGLNSQAKGGQA